MSVLIKNVMLNGETTCISIKNNAIDEIAAQIDEKAFDTVLDGTGQAVIPAFFNTHGHAAMTLFRGMADDIELFDWLNNHIWPAEAKLTAEHVYWGAKLACLEMIRSGTVFFNDMYMYPQAIIRAAEETGMRTAVGMIVQRNMQAPIHQKNNEEIFARRNEYSSRIQITYTPHAIYTVTEKQLRDIVNFSAEYKMRIHIHVSETEQEVKDCIREHGCSPVEYLDKLGVLTEHTIAAHSVHLSPNDEDIFANRQTVLSHNPCSNSKLVSGAFHFSELWRKGCRVTLGTDGCASNNNLSMLEEMKVASLNAKMQSKNPLGCSAEKIFQAATRNGAEAFGINAGVIEKGKLADLVLLDLNSPAMVPCINLISNIVYSANPSCIRTVICDGNILMKDGFIPWERETLEEARKASRFLCSKS